MLVKVLERKIVSYVKITSDSREQNFLENNEGFFFTDFDFEETIDKYEYYDGTFHLLEDEILGDE